MPALIETQALWKEYATPAGRLTALKGIHLRIEAGELVALTGPSGSGKSTLMNILGCLDRPTRGRYIFDGRDVGALAADELARARNGRIGFVFQSFNLLPRLTSLDNVALPLVYAGIARTKREHRALAMIERVGLALNGRSLPAQLSGGQQQRMAIARALVTRPQIILADEPTGSLDRQTGAEILELFAALNATEGICIVLVTHDPLVAGYARRLLRMVDGVLEYDGPLQRAA